MSLSDYSEAAILNSVFGKTSDFGALASAPSIYVALCESAPADDDAGSALTESSYTSYARVSTVAGDWDAATGTNPTTVDNGNAVTFPASTGGSSVVTHFAILDAATNGNLLAHGSLDSTKTIDSGDTPSFAAGALNFTLA